MLATEYKRKNRKPEEAHFIYPAPNPFMFPKNNPKIDVSEYSKFTLILYGANLGATNMNLKIQASADGANWAELGSVLVNANDPETVLYEGEYNFVRIVWVSGGSQTTILYASFTFS